MDIICTFALRLKVSEYIRLTLASLHGKIRCTRCITGTRRVVQLVHDEMYNWYTTSCATGDVRVVQLVCAGMYSWYVIGRGL